MVEPIKGNIWIEKNIPALEYIALPRASNLLGYDISDLIHWAEIGAIEVCLKIDWMPVAIETTMSNDSQSFLWINDQVKNGEATVHPMVHFSVSSIFHPSVIMADPQFSDIQYKLPMGDIGFNYQKSIDGAFFGHAEGLWSFFVQGVYSYFYYELLSNGSVTVKFLDLILNAADRMSEPDIYLKPRSFSEGDLFDEGALYDEIITPELVTITVNDIYITRRQVEYIYNKKGFVLDSFVTGDRARLQKEYSDINELDKKRRKAPKKEALIHALMNRNGIDSERPLKTLLGVLGVSEEKIRTYSEPQLHRTITKVLGDEMPDIDPKTLARWLKDEGAR